MHSLPFKGRAGVGMGRTNIEKKMKGQTNKFVEGVAKALRSNATDAERKLWQRLKSEQLGCKFRRQHPFGRYVLDFACLERMLVVEVDGGQHGEQVPYDDRRTRTLAESGFTVLRFWNHEVLNQIDDVVGEIWRALQPIPTPSLPLKGRGLKPGE